MSQRALRIVGSGVVCSVGLDAASTCAALRAGIAGFAELDIVDQAGQWLRGSRVPLDDLVSGTARRVRLLVMAVADALAEREGTLGRVALVACLGDTASAADRVVLRTAAAAVLARHVADRSTIAQEVVAGGRASVVPALARARELIAERRCDHVVVAGVDSLLSRRLLTSLERRGRLLTSVNSDGFLPGEAAAALLLAPAGTVDEHAVTCIGLGAGTDHSTIVNDTPLRADGLVLAVRAALSQAGCSLGDLDFRIADVSGEQYYFKEASLALGRLLRQRKPEFPLWLPADCVGEVGAAIGPLVIAVARSALRKGHAPGRGVLCHFSDDQGLRGAVVLRQGAIA